MGYEGVDCKWVTHLTDNPDVPVFQVFGKPVVTYCEFTLRNQPKNLATAKQVSIDTAMQYCEVRMGGLAILPNRAAHSIGFATW